MKAHTLAVAAALTAATITVPAFGQVAAAYTLIDVGLGDYTLRMPSINDAGQIVLGFATSPPVVWQNGITTPLPVPSGVTGVRATAINNSGQVVGGAGDSLFPMIGWFGGSPVTIPRPLANFGSRAVGINDAGLVLTYAPSTSQATVYNPSTGLHTFTGLTGGANSIGNDGRVYGAQYINGRNYAATSLNGVVTLVPGITIESATVAANGTGTTIGYLDYGNENIHPFRWVNGGAIEPLALPEGYVFGTRFFPNAINDSGLIVGFGFAPGRAALAWYGNTVVNLSTRLVNAPGWTLISATDVNESGQIVGVASFNGQDHVVLLTPVPTPAAGGLLALTLLTTARRRRA